MPETIYKTFYACNKCNHEYKQEYDAVMCETLPTLEEIEKLEQWNIGDELTFMNEYPIGSRWSYCTGGGKIVEKKLIRHQNNHQYLYWTDGGEGVLWIKDDFGWKLFSPAEIKRNSIVNF